MIILSSCHQSADERKVDNSQITPKTISTFVIPKNEKLTGFQTTAAVGSTQLWVFTKDTATMETHVRIFSGGPPACDLKQEEGSEIIIK